MGVGFDRCTDRINERLGELTPCRQILAGNVGSLFGVDILGGFELRDVVKQCCHRDDIDVRTFVLGDHSGEVDHVFDVVESVLRAVPGVPAHASAVVFRLDARREVVVDELLHISEFLGSDPRFFDFNTHGATSREG